ncbi:YaaC family protein [Bacillus marasmi]|uniref:YaaC family protein n=1 Tax=Bacillus marasmi TaxID=1926279 RepID=UPI0011CAD18A|nr:YaaC family protein [Bacillus marasmi]
MIYRNINSYKMFFSASFTQSFLKNCYLKQNIESAEQKSYQNCYPFIYYLEHGKIYYEQAEKSPLIIQPILLFYGFVHLIKACILTKDPSYPETTSVLAHGVSTRKRKKQQYCFLEDDVRIQKTGLFPYMSDQLFHMKQLEGDKVLMEELLTNIPELSQLFYQLEGRKTFINAELHNNLFTLSHRVLDAFHMTENRFEDFLRGKFKGSFSVKQGAGEQIEVGYNNKKILHGNEALPFRFNILEKHYCFPLNKEGLFQYPEMLIHYLLLYNLSMIARYETEWWSELMKMMSNNDYPFIQAFLEVTIHKGPFLVYQYLTNQLRG